MNAHEKTFGSPSGEPSTTRPYASIECAKKSGHYHRTPEDLIRFWLGHADETVTDGYSKLAEDVEYRKQVAAEVGPGFEISAQKPVVVPNVPSFALSVVQENVA